MRPPPQPRQETHVLRHVNLSRRAAEHLGHDAIGDIRGREHGRLHGVEGAFEGGDERGACVHWVYDAGLDGVAVGIAAAEFGVET